MVAPIPPEPASSRSDTPIPFASLDQKMTSSGSPFETHKVTVGTREITTWISTLPNMRAILENSRQFSERDYLIYREERLTYAEHYLRAAELATLMRERFDIKKGDRVALAMRNYPEWPIVFWATVSIGAIIVPLNAWLSARELRYALEDSGAQLLFADAEREALLRDSLHQLPSLSTTVVVRAEQAIVRTERTAGHAIQVLNWPDLFSEQGVERSADELPECSIDADDDAAIFYTSGTTGKPKGALLTHRNICSNQITGTYIRARTELRYGREPKAPTMQLGTLISVPLFHVTGSLSMLCGGTIQGSKLVFMHKWDAGQAIQLIEQEGLTAFGGVPSMPLQVIESPIFADHDTSSIIAVIYGGAPPSPELAQRIKKAFPNSSASNGYGLTETSGVATVNVAEDYLARPKSAGTPAPVTELRIVNGDIGADLKVSHENERLNQKKIGEIWVKGPQVFKGYWNNPKATAEAVTEGWIHTGDLGYRDSDGFLYVVDRAKDMLLRGGENIYCIEVENALYTHPAVLDAAVVGSPHPTLGETVVAMVQLKPGAATTEAALRDHVANQIAKFKAPERIDFNDSPLPRNANGKILKTEIKTLMGLGN